MCFMKNSLPKYLLLVELAWNVGLASLHASDFWLNNSITPQVENMVRYGDVETSLFTGTLNFSIPIYSLKDPDFNLDLTLYYNSDAFKPCKHSGWVGYNWYLSAGGCITREVRGYPDEAVRYRYPGGLRRDYYDGMYHYIKKNPNINPQTIFTQQGLHYCDSAGILNIEDNCSCYVDYMPDIFHFNFMGYSGTFMIDNTGKVQIVSGDYLDVDISKTIDEQKTGGTIWIYPRKTSQITIKTKDGYTYVFGGRLAALEFTYATDLCHTVSDGDYWNTYRHETFAHQAPPVVSSWHLSKVIAPNGRTMTYYYMEDGRFKYNYFLDDSNSGGVILDQGYDCLFYSNLNYDIFADMHAGDAFFLPFDRSSILNDITSEKYFSFIHSLTHNSLTSSVTKGCILDSIEVSGENPIKICFATIHCDRLFKIPGYMSYNRGNLMLKSVQVKSNDKILCEARLNYETKSSEYGNNWHILSTVDILGKGEYRLSYYSTQKYPSIGSCYDDDYIYDVDVFSGYWLTWSNQLKTYDDSFQGMLKMVSFPTGGKQEFEYEQHDFSTQRIFAKKRDHVESYPKEITDPWKIGGARIKQITTYDTEENIVEKREYDYNRGNTDKSSGVLYLDYGIYNESEDTISIVPTNYNYSIYDTHIGYSDVTEYVTDGNNRKLYKNAYSFDTGVKLWSSKNSSVYLGNKTLKGANNTLYNGMLFYDKHLYAKGKKLSQRYYRGNTLIQSIENVYNGEDTHNDVNQLGCVDSVVLFADFYDSYPVSRKLYIYPDVLTKEVIKEEGLTTTKTYTYDKKLRVTKETITDSRGIERFSKYTYPDNITNAATSSMQPALRIMVSKNRVNLPIESVSGYVDGNKNERITSGSVNLYAKGTGNGLYVYLNKTLSLAMTEPVTNYQPMQMGSSDVTYDSRYKLDAEYKFNQEGRLLSIKPFGKMETTYTWSGIYPTSKTIGNQTWKYSFIPYVGVKEIVDPRGVITRYEYDNAGRLIKESQVIDGKEQVLNVYQYHIKSEK